jgi:hydrogenase-1 operon protein HyaF
MKPFPIPVRMLGPGSQPPEDEPLQYLQMDREVETFSMPDVPRSADAAHMAGARDLLAGFHAALVAAPADASPLAELDLAALAAGPLSMVNQMLGEGEVAIRIRGTRDVDIQETIFAGVWRVQEHGTPGLIARDRLVACPVPQVVIDAAREAARPQLADVSVGPGAMNSPALMQEIRARCARRKPGTPAHVVNLSLLPLTPEDQRVLGDALPPGAVTIVSRGFGACRVSSTATRDVWRVQYFNSMQTLILNTIEVVDVPEVALAAPEDLADSTERLGELVDWMTEACTA